MDAAFFEASRQLSAWMPHGVTAVRRPEELAGRRWPLLALTGRGCARLAANDTVFGCDVLVLPGDWGSLLPRIRAERVVSYGLSPRDSLTLSSLGEQAVVCVQRTLPRPDGGCVEPQEIPLPAAEGLSPEDLLAVFGVKLLLEPQEKSQG